MQSFFFIFFHIQKIAPQIAKKADNTNTPTTTRHTIGRHSVNMEATGTPGTAGHPVPGPAADPGLLILSGGSLIQVDPSSDGPSIPGRWVTVGDGSWTVGDGSWPVGDHAHHAHP